MEDFVDEYYSIANFTTTYSRVVPPIGDKLFWPEVPFAKEVGAPIGKRDVGRQRENRINGCLEGGSEKKLTMRMVRKAFGEIATIAVPII
jgi:hypothetical protein